jgi:hypothetical protein
LQSSAAAAAAAAAGNDWLREMQTSAGSACCVCELQLITAGLTASSDVAAWGMVWCQGC